MTVRVGGIPMRAGEIDHHSRRIDLVDDVPCITVDEATSAALSRSARSLRACCRNQQRTIGLGVPFPVSREMPLVHGRRRLVTQRDRRSGAQLVDMVRLPTGRHRRFRQGRYR